MAGLSLSALFNLFSTGQYSDFTITCKDREFKVHKTIICPDSQFFQAVCRGNFKALFEPEQDGVELKEQDPEIVAKVLHYLYFGNYHDDTVKCDSDVHQKLQEAVIPSDSDMETGTFSRLFDTSSHPVFDDNLQSQLQMHIAVYQTADILGIDSLKLFTVLNAIKTIYKMRVDVLPAAFETFYKFSASDTSLREALNSAWGREYPFISENPNIVKVLKEHEPALWRFMGAVRKAELKRAEGYVQCAIEDEVQIRECFDEDCPEPSEGLTMRIAKATSSQLDICTECTACGKEYCTQIVL